MLAKIFKIKTFLTLFSFFFLLSTAAVFAQPKVSITDAQIPKEQVHTGVLGSDNNSSGSPVTVKATAKTASDTEGTEGKLPHIPKDIQYLIAALGFGDIAGWAVGFTCKKIAKVVAIIFGISFLVIQLLSYKKFITIDWEKVQSSVDGVKAENFVNSLMGLLVYNLPFVGAFLTGFWLGFRKG